MGNTPRRTQHSALVIAYRQHGEMASEYIPCQNGCRSGHGGSGTQDTGRAVAFCRVTIAGYPAGGLCRSCAKAWRQAWDDALAGFPDDKSEPVPLPTPVAAVDLKAAA